MLKKAKPLKQELKFDCSDCRIARKHEHNELTQMELSKSENMNIIGNTWFSPYYSCNLDFLIKKFKDLKNCK